MLRYIVMALAAGMAVLSLADLALAKVSEADIKKIAAAVPDKAPATPAKPRKILIYSHCNGFPHTGAIERAKVALPMIGEKTGAYTAVVSDDLANFEPDKINEFDAIVLSNTTGELFQIRGPERPGKPDAKKIKDPADLEKAEAKYKEDLAKWEEANKEFKSKPQPTARLRKSFMDWVKAGHGVIGIHSATDCSYGWKEFGEMIGGYFNGHPWSEKVAIKNDDPTNPINAAFDGKGFEVGDEIYAFRDPYSRDKQRVLLSLDTPKLKKKGNRKDEDYAVSWIKKHGEGRIFYCSLGHWDQIFYNPVVLQHYLAGIQWAIGDLKADCTPVPLKTEKSE